METLLTYRKRVIGPDEIALIRELISADPTQSRRALSQEVCRRWSWRQANGQLKDMVCRGLLLELERRGHIRLPPPKRRPPNPLAQPRRQPKVSVDDTPLEATLEALGPLALVQVRRTIHEALFSSLLTEHHYLGCPRFVGEHLKYVLFARDRPVACIGWGSALPYIGARDRFIGWSDAQRERHLHLVADNVRFLIPPWVRVPNLASRALAVNRKRLSHDWEALYAHPIHLVQTFVDPRRFQGACYKADNWRMVGLTTGRGKWSPTREARFPKKMVFVRPLTPRFKELCRACGNPSH